MSIVFYLFLVLTLLLLNTHAVSIWQRSWNYLWNSACMWSLMEALAFTAEKLMRIWFPGWIIVLSWGQSKEQELTTELLAEDPCSCGTEQCSQEKIRPALHLAAWMMLQSISSSWIYSEWDRKQLQWESSSCSHWLPQEISFFQSQLGTSFLESWSESSEGG